MDGWIKLHRKLLESIIFSSDKGLKVWVWCLLKANHKEKTIYIGLHKITLMPGQFIFGRDTASKDLKMSPSTVRNWIRILKQDSYIDISVTNKYSVITINNWSDYQSNDSKKDNRITTEKQQNNTNNNDKNVKNDINNIGASPNLEKLKEARKELAEKLSFKNTVGVNHQWQSEAFRIAESLKITLIPEYKTRWLKLFKDAFMTNNRANLYIAYSFISDYPKQLKDEDKIKLFFWKFYNPTTSYKN